MEKTYRRLLVVQLALETERTRDMPHPSVLVELAFVAQVQAELQNKNLTALEEVKLLKAHEETDQSGAAAWHVLTGLPLISRRKKPNSRARCGQPRKRRHMFTGTIPDNLCANCCRRFPFHVVQANDKVKRLSAELESEKAGGDAKKI